MVSIGKACTIWATALAFEREGDLWSASAQLQKLVEDHPGSERAAQGLLKISDFLVSQGKSEEAKAQLLKTISAPEAGPAKTLARRKLGEILKAQGHSREALVYLHDALKTARGEAACEIQYTIAEIYETQGQAEQAASTLLKTADLCPDDRQKTSQQRR